MYAFNKIYSSPIGEYIVTKDNEYVCRCPDKKTAEMVCDALNKAEG